MTVDINVKSMQLLEKLANAIYDREPKNSTNMFHFKTSDIGIVEDWLRETIGEVLKSMGEY